MLKTQQHAKKAQVGPKRTVVKQSSKKLTTTKRSLQRPHANTTTTNTSPVLGPNLTQTQSISTSPILSSTEKTDPSLSPTLLKTRFSLSKQSTTKLSTLQSLATTSTNSINHSTLSFQAKRAFATADRTQDNDSLSTTELTPEQLLYKKTTNHGRTLGINAHEATNGSLLDEEGIPIRRVHSKQTYVFDPNKKQQVVNPTPAIADWPAYKEISTLVSSGQRANVYHWLSDRNNRLRVDLNVQDTYGSTLLSQAARHHFYAVSLTLLPFCDTNFASHQGAPLFHSLSLADLLITRALLDFGADPNVRNAEQQTPLMLASCVDNLSFIQYLIFKGSDLNAQDDKGRTALMYAAKKCSPQISRYLYICGANPDLVDDQGRTATDYARARNDRDGESITYLLSKSPPTSRILPDKEKIDRDLKRYREEKVYPRPLNFNHLKNEYLRLSGQYGYQSLVIDPNGAISLKKGVQDGGNDGKYNLNLGASNGGFDHNNNNNDNAFINADDIQSNNTSRRRPHFQQRRTVFEDLMERSDFYGRQIEHVDTRYLDWYDRCRQIHLEDETFRSGSAGKDLQGVQLKPQRDGDTEKQ